MFKGKPILFYAYMRDSLKVKPTVTKLEKENGSVIKDDKEVAETLSRFFKSVYTEEDVTTIPNFNMKVPQENIINDVDFTEEDVYKKLCELREDKACRPDDISRMVLKHCASMLKVPLHILFRTTLDEGCLPWDWKKANVCPIFKKGSRKKPNNYRPVSLKSTACKIMKKLMRDGMLNHMNVNNLFSAEQHGFMEGRSCLTNLLETLEFWTHSTR